MGKVFALDLAVADLDLRSAVGIHLTSNHYPPVPVSMVTACVEAINLCNEGSPDDLVELPTGVLWRYETSAPAWAIVEGHHLDPWLTDDDPEL